MIRFEVEKMRALSREKYGCVYIDLRATGLAHRHLGMTGPWEPLTWSLVVRVTRSALQETRSRFFRAWFVLRHGYDPDAY